MQDRMRLYATMVIWAAFTIMSVIMFSSVIAKSSSTFNDIIPLMGIVGGAAIVGTFSVWISALGSRPSAAANSRSHAELAKRKRLDRARMERLVSQMDADALDELEDLLLERSASAEQQRGGYSR